MLPKAVLRMAVLPLAVLPLAVVRMAMLVLVVLRYGALRVVVLRCGVPRGNKLRLFGGCNRGRGCNVEGGMELKNRLYRSSRERMISGVAGGLAEYVDLDPTIVRVLWVVALLTTGPVALLLYLLCAMIIPREPDITLV